MKLDQLGRIDVMLAAVGGLCMKPIDTSAASIAAVAMRRNADAERSRGESLGRRVDFVISCAVLGAHPERSSQDCIGGRTADDGGTEYTIGRIDTGAAAG